MSIVRRVLALGWRLLLLGTPAAVWAQTERQVTIYRDPRGVPHSYADREASGFFGLGYAQAEDRLNVVLALYARVKGQQALAFGPSFVVYRIRFLGQDDGVARPPSA